jgi:hypothetical protein
MKLEVSKMAITAGSGLAEAPKITEIFWRSFVNVHQEPMVLGSVLKITSLAIKLKAIKQI